MSKHANSELAAVAWARQVTGIPGGQVATVLPTANTSWAASGFVQVTSIVGGTPQVYVPVREPVVQFDLWAVNLNSDQPNWGLANELAEKLVEGTYAGDGIGTALTTRTGYRDVVIMSAYPVSEPRRVYDDPTAYGHYQVDILLRWKEVED